MVKGHRVLPPYLCFLRGSRPCFSLGLCPSSLHDQPLLFSRVRPTFACRLHPLLQFHRRSFVEPQHLRRLVATSNLFIVNTSPLLSFSSLTLHTSFEVYPLHRMSRSPQIHLRPSSVAVLPLSPCPSFVETFFLCRSFGDQHRRKHSSPSCIRSFAYLGRPTPCPSRLSFWNLLFAESRHTHVIRSAISKSGNCFDTLAAKGDRLFVLHHHPAGWVVLHDGCWV